jgi:glycosyltransferase involved in cell wall biosynthesis
MNNGKTGLKFQLRDAEDLVEAMLELLSDEKRLS